MESTTFLPQLSLAKLNLWKLLLFADNIAHETVQFITRGDDSQVTSQQVTL